MRTAQIDQPGRRRTVAGYAPAGSGGVSGPGWTVTRIALGQYKLAFTEPFAEIPAVTLTAHAGNGRVYLVQTAVAVDSVTIWTWDTAQNSSPDSYFSFTANGKAR